MLKRILSLTLWLLALVATAQTAPEAYRLYDAKGCTVSYAQVVKSLAKADAIFVGEIHNCVLTHWMELRLLEDIYNSLKGKPLAVGMEMFEADNQLILDEYMHRVISADRFENECRLWPNYSTDYEPLVYFAKQHELPLIATNVPRRYANVVKERGLAALDSLSEEAKTYLPPLPLPYIKNEAATEGFSMMKMIGGKAAARIDTERMSEAQAVKDATMGWNIAQRLTKGGKLIHFNGSYHSDARGGIIPYLEKYRPGTSVRTIRAVRQEDISRLDSAYMGLADFYICIPEDMPMSY